MSSFVSNPRIKSPITQTKPMVNIIVAIVIPETGEFEEPTTPAIYPATAAKKKETAAKNNAPLRQERHYQSHTNKRRM